MACAPRRVKHALQHVRCAVMSKEKIWPLVGSMFLTLTVFSRSKKGALRREGRHVPRTGAQRCVHRHPHGHATQVEGSASRHRKIPGLAIRKLTVLALALGLAETGLGRLVSGGERNLRQDLQGERCQRDGRHVVDQALLEEQGLVRQVLLSRRACCVNRISRSSSV